MKKSLLIILSILCLILCLGLASCGGNGGTEGNENYVTITFDTKGGSVLDSVQVEKGGEIPKPQDPTKEGYTFSGWCYGEKMWSFARYVATEDMTLEASWTPTTYTIEYNGGVNHTNKTRYTVEDEIVLTDGNKDYYEFLGWYLDKELTKPISKIEKGTTGNLKLYGKTEYTGIMLELNGSEYTLVDCDKNATSIVIPEKYKGLKVTSIGEGAFEGCTGLTSIEIPNNVTSIDDNAFYGCTGLTSVTIGDSVTSIGSGAFLDCTSLTSVDVPNSVTTIGDGAFENCTGLEEITLPFVGNGSDQTHFGYIFGASYYSNNNGYVPTSLKKVTITGGASISEYAFYCCENLASITIGDSVTSIGEKAFKGCASIEEITLPFVGNGSGKTHFGYIFGASSNIYNGDCVPIRLNKVTITKGTIDGYAFYGCTSLRSITIGDSVTSIGEYAFYICTRLISITIGDSVTTIGDFAFRGCTGLTGVTIGDGVTSIGNYAFMDCISLTSITIPNSVTSIGNSAFSGCTRLTSIVIPNSVTSIGDDAFYYCTRLTIYCEAESKPDGWNNSWNLSNCPVVWGYSAKTQ